MRSIKWSVAIEIKDGSWGVAINMGDGINSELEDAFGSVTPECAFITDIILPTYRGNIRFLRWCPVIDGSIFRPHPCHRQP